VEWSEAPGSTAEVEPDPVFDEAEPEIRGAELIEELRLAARSERPHHEQVAERPETISETGPPAPGADGEHEYVFDETEVDRLIAAVESAPLSEVDIRVKALFEDFEELLETDGRALGEEMTAVPRAAVDVLLNRLVTEPLIEDPQELDVWAYSGPDGFEPEPDPLVDQFDPGEERDTLREEVS
jgi:hypothetical protein